MHLGIPDGGPKPFDKRKIVTINFFGVGVGCLFPSISSLPMKYRYNIITAE